MVLYTPSYAAASGPALDRPMRTGVSVGSQHTVPCSLPALPLSTCPAAPALVALPSLPCPPPP